MAGAAALVCIAKSALRGLLFRVCFSGNLLNRVVSRLDLLLCWESLTALQLCYAMIAAASKALKVMLQESCKSPFCREAFIALWAQRAEANPQVITPQ